MYIGESKEKIFLKGNDALFKELLKKYCKGMEIIEVCFQSEIMRKEVFNLIRTSDAFEALYGTIYISDEEEDDDDEKNDESDQEEEEDRDNEESKRDIQSKKPKKFDKIHNLNELIKVDSKNTSIAISEKYLLGDVVFLKTCSKKQKIFECRDEEINLGNEGFQGTYLKNLALVAELDYDLIKNK